MVTPDQIEQPCLELLRNDMKHHLARLETERGLSPRTLEPLKTVDLLSGPGVVLRTDRPPVVLLGIFGAPRPETKTDSISLLWTLMLQLVVVGRDRADTMKRRGWYAMAVAECLVQRLPKLDVPVQHIELADLDFSNGTTTDDSRQAVGEAQLIFDVRSQEALHLTDLPPDAVDPQDPPVITSVTTTVTRDL